MFGVMELIINAQNVDILRKKKKAVMSKGTTWCPSPEHLKEAERLAYLGITALPEFAISLGVTIHQLSQALICDDEFLNAVNRGKTQMHQRCNAVIIDVMEGRCEDAKQAQVQFTAARYLLQARFEYDESSAQTRSKRSVEEKKLDLEERKFKARLEENAEVKKYLVDEGWWKVLDTTTKPESPE